jgi:hypothetical protein
MAPPWNHSPYEDLMTFRQAILSLAVAFPCFLVFGCKKTVPQVERGDTPPPVESTQLGRCAQGGGTVSDAASAAFFARNVNDYCIDPNSETRAYGKSAPGTLDQVCTELFDGECEVYKAYGLERVVTIRYADAKGSTSTVNVVLSRFETPRGAYGFFTKRVVADSDPADSKAKALAAGGAAALASTIAYVWRGSYVAELSYVNDSESPDALRQSAAKILPDIAKSIGSLVPGDVKLPDTADLLPREGLLPLGILYEPHDVLGVQGVGPGSYGFYAEEGRRYRTVLLERGDEASAQDILKTLKKLPAAGETKTRPPVVTLTLHPAGAEAVKSEWLFAREGNRVVGIGDEELVLNQANAEQARAKSLKREEKLERLNKLVTSLKNRPAAAPRGTSEADTKETKKE